MTDIKKLDKKYVMGTYNRFNINIVNGKGSLVYDEKGNEYIDLTSGIGVTALGFNNKDYIKAVCDQLKKVQHTSNLYYTAPCVNLAKTLCERTGFKKVFFSNSGAEANECAIKAARKYGFLNKGKKCFNIITLNNSFHGRTITTLAATGQEVFHKDFLPLTSGFKSVPANDFKALKKAANKNTAAIMIELIQGEGGVNVLDKNYVKEVYEFCKLKDILLIVDEVQTGNGRTGKLYSYEHYDIMPDIITTAKGLGGGLPIGATLFNSKVENILGFSEHGSTFGANPVSCAAALSVLEKIDENLLLSVEKKGKLINESLKDCKGVLSISGKGLMIGIETKKDIKTVIAKLQKKGVLVLSAKNKIRLLPALNIKEEVLIKAINIIKEVI